MIQSKAIDILGSLSNKEFQQFGKYLDSSAFTSHKNLPKLYRFLKKYHPVFDSDSLTKESIYRAVYGSSAYDDSKTRKLLSDIYKEAEKFIVILNVFSQKETYDKIILEELDIRKLDSIFISKYDEVTAYLDGSEKHYQYYLDKFLVEWKNIMFHLERGMQHKIALNIYKRTEYLIFFFLSDLFLSLNDIDSNRHAYNIINKVNLAEFFISNLNDKKLLEYIRQNKFENTDLVYTYYLGYLALKNFNDEQSYYNLKEFVLKNIDSFHEGSQKTSVIFLISYCTRKLRLQRTRKFELELNEWYNLYIKYKLHKISGENYIRSDLFLNILANYFDVGRISEAGKFLEDNIESIQPSHRKNMLAIANALIQFEKRNFGESLKHSSLIKSNTFLYKDKVKLLILKNNYELKNFEIAKELSHNYRNFLQENKNITDLQKERGTKFLHYYNILWRIFDGKGDKISLTKLKEEIAANSRFNESVWIQDKVNEFTK
ncbi:MAG: hypothetical protein ABI543_00420 [Ignavibacteria bacterium]